MRITIDLSGIEGVREQFARLGNAPQHALDVTAEKLEDFIQAQIGPHAKTGMLERSLGKVRIPAGWEIGHDSRVAPYARFVHDGTKPHLIFPSKKKALRWAGGGVFHFANVVHHPGNKPDKWMDRAAAQAPIIFRAEIERLIQQRT
jgi:hypothetical protein